MPAGLRAWNENGKLIMDTTTRTTRILGVRDLEVYETEITHPGLVEGTPFYVFNFLGEASGYNSGTYGVAPLGNPVVTFLNPTTMRVQLGFAGQKYRFTFGVY